MFLSLKTLYRKRTVIWPFTFTQLYGLYHISSELFQSNNNLKKEVEEQKKYIKELEEKSIKMILQN